ncbi:MAG: TetR/AcrR family transcriptional regulator [Acidimicrobiia bacterium]|nr:TetR/AcrR family transcriptional regulator [Acidimicrobiia bacterium]
MRETQRLALRLFRDRGFTTVTVEEIASELQMAASTIYRHFGTKENLVLWDEHDPAIEAALGQRLGSEPPLAAIRDAFIETLADLYADDLDFQLDRISYIFETPELHAAAVEADFRARHELTVALTSVLPKADREAAPILAGAALLALDAAMDRWQSGKGRPSLTTCIERAFATVADLGSIG